MKPSRAIQILTFFPGITTEEDKKLAATGDYNFDHPDAFDWELVSIPNISYGLEQKPVLPDARCCWKTERGKISRDSYL